MELFDKVKLFDGTVGRIVEVLEDDTAFIVEYATPDGPHSYDIRVVSRAEIEPERSDSLATVA